MAARSRPKATRWVGNENRALRESTGLKQPEFAQLLGHRRQLIIKMEKDDCDSLYYPDELRKIQEYVNRPVLRALAARPSFSQLRAKYHAEENWIDLEHSLPFVAIFPLMDQPPILLTKKQVRGNRINEEPFHIPPARLPKSVCERIIESFRLMLPKDTQLYDEITKARLVKATYDDQRALLHVQYGITSYYNNLITQRLADYQLLWPEETSPENIRTLGDIFDTKPGDGHLPPLGIDSPVANLLGRGALIFNRDHALILVLRSNKVVADAGLYDLAIQGSGDIDTEFNHYDVFRDFRREAKNELNLDMRRGWEKFSDGTEAIFVLGLVRDVTKAGKPDFLFVGKSTYTTEELETKAKNAKEWWENNKLIAVPPTAPLEDLYTRLSSASDHSPTCRAAISLLLRWARAKGICRDDSIEDLYTQLFEQ